MAATSSSSSSTAASSGPSSVSAVVRFAYKNFQLIEGNKWRAACCHCGESIKESRGTTSGFNKYEFLSASWVNLLQSSNSSTYI
jgi:hypothetical protein